MEKNYAYENDDIEEGITFKKVGYFFKKGWLRMVIYTAVLLVLALAIALPIKSFYKSEPVAQTTVEFIYKGIEKGESPDGSPFNSNEMITPQVLASAVATAGLNDKIPDISKLREITRVESVETDEYVRLVQAAEDGNAEAANTLRNYTMYPTRFNIVLSNPESVGLSDEQAKLLLDNIVKSYYANFKDSYAISTMFPANMYNTSADELTEFTDIYDLYTKSLDAINSYLTDMSTQNPTFTSTKNSTTFAQLLSDVNLLSNSYTSFNAFILSNNIWRNAATAKNTLSANLTEITTKRDELKIYIENLKTQIELIKPTTTTIIDASGNTSTVTTSYPSEYYKFQSDLDKHNRDLLDYNIQIANTKTRLENLPETGASDPALIARATQMLTALETQTSALVSKVNATIEDFYDVTLISSSVRQVQAPVVTRRGTNFSIMIVLLVTAVAGLLIASIVTGWKISKAKSVAKQRANVSADSEDATEKEEQDKNEQKK